MASEYRGQHALDPAPELGKSLVLPELGGGRFRFGESEQLTLAIAFGDEGLERLREAIGGAMLGDDRSGDELRDRAVRHPLRRRRHDVDAAGHGLGAVALREQREHRLGRQPAGGVAHLLEHRVELVGPGLQHVLGEAAQDVQEHRGPDVDPLAGGLGLEPGHQRIELGGIADDLEQGAGGVVIELELRPAERGGENLIDRRGGALLLAQHLGVVDFDDLEARSACRRPQMGDAAVGADLLRRAGEEEQERSPRGRIGTGIHGQRANEVAVEHFGEFADRRIGPGGKGAVEQYGHAADLETEGARFPELGGRLGEAAQRHLDRRMRAGVERDGARPGLAGACEFGEPHRGRGSQRRRGRIRRRHGMRGPYAFRRRRAAALATAATGARHEIPCGSGVTSDIWAVRSRAILIYRPGRPPLSVRPLRFEPVPGIDTAFAPRVLAR